MNRATRIRHPESNRRRRLCPPPIRREFKPCAPLLVVAPQSVLEFWDGEWQFWTTTTGEDADDDAAEVNVALYSGPASVRACVLEYEAWLDPTSTDGKAVVKVSGGGGAPSDREPEPVGGGHCH